MKKETEDKKMYLTGTGEQKRQANQTVFTQNKYKWEIRK